MEMLIQYSMNFLEQEIHLRVIRVDLDFFVSQVDDGGNRTFGKKFGGLHGMAHTFVKTQDPPVEFALDLTLEELYHGCVKKVKISRRILSDDGMTTASSDKILTIEVGPGWKEGTKIVFSKEGDQGANKIPGKLI
jgi:DnaJ homolog subfamily B member 13